MQKTDLFSVLTSWLEQLVLVSTKHVYVLGVSSFDKSVCIINDEGVCWCGQRWDGEKMLSANSGTEKTKELDKKELPNK